MKVLIVTHHYLDGNGGGVFASRAFINAFASIYGDVTLMCPVKPGCPPEHISSGVRIIAVSDTRSPWKKTLDLVRGCFHRFSKDFPELLSKESFALIVFDTCYPAGDLAKPARKSGARIVTIHHNWQYAYERDNAKGLTRPVRLLWLPSCEREAILSSDINITLTEQDREALYRCYNPSRTCRIEVCAPFEYE